MAVALIPAAGSGERLGAGRPKALVELGGRPLIAWSLDVLSRVPAIEKIVVALPAHALELPWTPQGAPDVATVPGGATRSESVRSALAAAGEAETVLVHDAARPLLRTQLVEDTLGALAQEGADGAIAAARVTDTVKEAGEDGTVVRTLARSALWAVQTPQVFRRSALEEALNVPDEVLAQATDDAWLLERAGYRVVVVEAPRENIKVTSALDLAVAEALLERRPA